MKRTKRDIDPNERKYTIKEAAPLLGLHPQIVKLRCESGEIRATKPGRCWLIPQSAIQEHLTSRGMAVATPKHEVLAA